MKKPVYIILFLAISLFIADQVMAAPPADCSGVATACKIYGTVPSYDQSFLDINLDEIDENPPGACSEFSLTMMIGYYDGLGWKRFIPFGSNLALKNPLGVLETVTKVINQFGTAGGGMSDSKWLTNSTNFPILTQALDGNASFTAGYKTENDPLTVITFSDIKNHLNSAPGVFGTWDPIYYRYDNSSTRNSVDNHDMPAIGYIENYPKWSITANWLLTKSTWTNNAAGDIDPLWFNYDADVDLSDNVTYGYFAAGSSPSSLSDTTDDLYEDNDYRGDASAILLPFSDSSLKCNDHDWFKLTNVSAGATINVTTNFTHANGDLDLTLWNSSGTQVGLSVSTSNQEVIAYAVPSTGDYYIKVYGYNGAKNSYGMSVTVMDAVTPPAVEFSSASSSGSEATTPAAITVTLSEASSQTVTVNYATANGTATAGNDYATTSGTLTFNPGVTSQTINVPITNDTIIETNETFTVTLSSPVNATLGTTITHTYKINNDDSYGSFQLSSATYSVSEGESTVTITATRTGGSSGGVSFSYWILNGTATDYADYRLVSDTLNQAKGGTAYGLLIDAANNTAGSGWLSWADGDTADKSITVAIINDTLNEQNETFSVGLNTNSVAMSAVVGQDPSARPLFGSPNSATVTIIDDDTADPNSAYVNPLGACSGNLPCYSTIQAAIDASADGATITIAQGTYHENILINKTLILSGGWNSSVTTQSADPGLTILNGDTDNDGVGEGSVLSITAGAHVTIDNLTIIGGDADTGGGLNIASAFGLTDVSLSNCIISSNSAEEGAGIHALAQGGSTVNLSIQNCLIIGNNAVNGGGGIEATATDTGSIVTVNMVNNTITRNTAAPLIGGGGVHATASNFGAVTVTEKNDINWGNTAPTGPDVYSSASGGATAVVRAENSDIGSGPYTDLGGNIGADPEFLNSAGHDYRLDAISPCIDKGTASGAPTDDILGVVRPQGPAADMGAYEFTGTSVAVVRLLSLSGGEHIPAGEHYTVRWEKSGIVANIALSYSISGGAWTKLKTPKTFTGTSFNWILKAPTTNLDNVKLKITAYNSAKAVIAEVVSDYPFSMYLAWLKYPNGGEHLKSGRVYRVLWDTSTAMKKPPTKVSVEYSTNDGATWFAIGLTTGNPGYYDWTVPAVVTPTSYQVRVVLKDSKGKILASDASDDAFTIVP